MHEFDRQFDFNIFINCPFDDEYKPILRAILFTIVYCGLNPKVASTNSDSGEVRIRKIAKLIKESKYSIHDISRMEALTPGELPRFNLPFELGFDLGIRESAFEKWAQKRCLVLEKEEYRFRKVLSDISGNDIKAHQNSPENAVRRLRHWLLENVRHDLPSGTQIWEAYNIFNASLGKELKIRGFQQKDLEDMPMSEFINFINTLCSPSVSLPPGS